MNPTLHIIANCTNRKRLPIPPTLHLGSIAPSGSIEADAAAWRHVLDSHVGDSAHAAELYSGDYWSVVRTLPDIAAARGYSAELWVASAGYGLIRATACVHAYSATFADGPDAVSAHAKPTTSRTQAYQTWWSCLAEFAGPEPGRPRTITDIVRGDPNAHMLVVVSRDYLRALAGDIAGALTAMKDPRRLIIISSNEGSSTEALRGNLLPSGDRFRLTLGGALVSLHARVARQVLGDGAEPDIDATELIPRYERYLAEQTPIDGPKRTTATDAEIRVFIRTTLARTPTAAMGSLLRAFRDSGRACEYRRFQGLYRTVKEVQSSDRPSRFDSVVEIPDEWWRQHTRRRLRYFIPEWDDLVDPEYDFLTDTHADDANEWTNQAYAHQLYSEPNYDGLLVSRAVIESGGQKTKAIHLHGVHRYLRVPPAFPIIGDCGAFSYISADVPPYTTTEVIDYYTGLGLNYGVSVDHLIVTSDDTQRRFRYELTMNNAEEFLREHRARGLPWEPIGAVQGWNPQSYARAAQRYVAMGYQYIGLGGLVRSKTIDILRILAAVHEVVPPEVRIHLFGLARLEAIEEFVRLGASSIDSASPLRKAWLGADKNYLAPNGWYAAIRVPHVDTSPQALAIVRGGQRSLRDLSALEDKCLQGLRAYAAGETLLNNTLLDLLVEYDALLQGDRSGTRDRIRRTLEDRPWEQCSCPICKKCGIEVVIFRGNNRNRRRGFHNTFVFYRLIERVLSGHAVTWLPRASVPASQLDLFPTVDPIGATLSGGEVLR